MTNVHEVIMFVSGGDAAIRKARINKLENSMEVTVICPFCGEPNVIWIDPTGGSSQSYVEDCEVCCQAWQVSVRFDDDGEPSVSVEMI